jgi:tRNA dimethylallyltransferase
MNSSGALAGNRLRVICGPTGAGKSALAIALAAQRDLLILSADSRQIYRGFDIGSAKPTAEERDLIPHRGIDVVEPGERFSAASWAAAARDWIAEAAPMGRTPVVVGGTGFYIRALTAPLFEEPPLDPEQRAKLAGELAKLSVAELRRRVEQVDPARAKLGRAQLLRALEVATLTGTPISTWHERSAAGAPGVPARYLVVDPGTVLRDWIADRAEGMFEGGWVEEVAALAETVPDDAPAWNATGYAVIRDVVRGTIDREEALALVTIATRQYAKRQRTWFRHQIADRDVTRIDPRSEDVLERALAWWDADEGGTGT